MGWNYPLPDASVDIVFSAEYLSTLKFPSRFLRECYRVLRVGGQLILTAPNRDAILYQTQCEQYGLSPKQFSLFNAAELKSAVGEFFDIEMFAGFNSSMFRTLDPLALSPEACEEWAAQHFQQPELATNMVFHAVKKTERAVKAYQVHPLPANRLTVSGHYQILHLDLGLTGMMVDGADASIQIACPPCSGLVMHFWMHRWSGVASVRCGEQVDQYNLYSYDPGWKRVQYEFETPLAREFEIKATGGKDFRAENSEVIFFEAFTYQH